MNRRNAFKRILFAPGALRLAMSLAAVGFVGAGIPVERLAGQTVTTVPPMTRAAGPSLVVLVRHAEKATEPAADPDLSPAGVERAKALAEALVTLSPNAIIVTSTRRTAQTAAPLAAKYGVRPEAVALAGAAAHIAAVADAVMKHDGVVVVVGHSNTISAIIKALGGPEMRDLCDSEFNNLFVLKPGVGGKPAELIRVQYGAPDPPRAPGCPSMGN